ncbi:MAG: hypothetical protein MUF54_17925, partial [Polyangiaceae bacterium]|nr:hypothetical protein [Polyangiaceae bacterium]
PDLVKAVAKLRRGGAQVRWMTARQEQAISLDDSPVGRIVADAVILRSRTARERGERVLASMGVKVQRMRRRVSVQGESMSSVTTAHTSLVPPES